MPPRMVPKARGISSREGFTPERLAAPETGGSSTAAAAMLFMNRERKAPESITVTTSRCSLAPATRTRRSPTRRVTPVRSSPAARMKIASSVITADRLNPEKVSSDVSTPDAPRATTTRSATRSARSRSVSSRTMAAPAMARVVRRWGFIWGGQAAIIAEAADAKCKDPCDGASVACDLTLCLPLLKEREDASGRVVGRRNMLGFERKEWFDPDRKTVRRFGTSLPGGAGRECGRACANFDGSRRRPSAGSGSCCGTGASNIGVPVPVPDPTVHRGFLLLRSEAHRGARRRNPRNAPAVRAR